MTLHHKVGAHHLRRAAYLYIRQSTMRQVLENNESTRRQYALRERALSLGWRDEQVLVVDCDQGESGAADREGFRHLMAEVGLGRAGIVLGLEVSRLARNSIDWHRLLEVCALTDTLILDEDGVYSPRDYNDRLLLGLKGAMSEAELHVLKARMQGGILNQARRGALKQHLPTGFVYDQNRQVMLDPDAQVRDTIVHLFVTFERTGSACAVVRHFRDRAMKFPHRQGHGYRLGALRWQALTVSRTRDILHNPRYAGAFAYGRTRRVHQARNRLTIARVPVEDWKALVRDVHAGYITWDQYESNLRQLRDNHRGSVPPGPPREGAALLQGIVLCGLCGTHMLTRYRPGKHAPRAEYFCNGRLDHTAAPRCQSIPGAFIDRAIGVLLIELVEPVALETALSVHEELQARNDEVAALREQAVQRAREAAELARRRYMETDPGNRLVADVLEAEWENGLRAVREAEEERDRRRAEDRLAVGDDARRRILALATDFPRLWNDPATPNRERKRMARVLLEDITLTRGTRGVLAGIRLRGGQTRQLCVPFDRDTNPRKHRAPIIAEIEELLVQQADAQVAAILNQRGRTNCDGKPFNAHMVGHIRRSRGLKTRTQRLRDQGMVTTRELADQLGISEWTVRDLVRKRLLDRQQCADRCFLYQPPKKDHRVHEWLKTVQKNGPTDNAHPR